MYTERQKSCNTLRFFIIFQTIMTFENNDFSMNGQVISNRFCISSEIIRSDVSEFPKMLKLLILT